MIIYKGKNMEKILKKFERIIVMSLLSLMMIAVFFYTIQLALLLYRQLLKPPVYLLDLKEILEVFGFFLMVLIGLELIESMKAYIEDSKVHAELVLLVAIVAISRKVIIIDYKQISPEMLYGVALIIVALGISYYLVRKTLYFCSPNKKDKEKSFDE